MNQDQGAAWSDRWNDFGRRHPLCLLLIMLALAVMATPLMIAAAKTTAVLYQDF